MADFKKSRRKGFGVGASNTQILEALYKKYSRDYLRYFKELSDNYKIGPNKEEVDKTVELIKRMLVVLENVITTGIITEEDSEKLSEFSENIELQKQFFIQEIQKDTVLQQLLSVINEKTGISLEEMTSVEGVVEKGLQQVRKSQARKRVSFAEKAPHIAALGKGAFQESLKAATGPVYPLLEKAFGIGKDIFSLGKGLSQKRREKEEESAIAQTFPSSFREPRTRDFREARGAGSSLGSMVGIAGRETLDKQVAPLKRFFDKEAYQTKWTKELLDATKEAKERKEKNWSFLDIFEGKIGVLTLGLAALATSVIAAKRFLDTWKSKEEITKAAVDIGSSAGAGAGKTLEQIKKFGGIDVYAKKLGKTPKQVALDVAYLEQLESLGKRAEQPWYKKTLQSYGLMKRPEIVSVPTRAEEIQKEFSPKNIPTNFSQPPLKIEVPPVPGLDVLKETIERLTEQLQRNQESAPVKTGNVFDSGDTLLTEHAKGNLNFDR